MSCEYIQFNFKKPATKLPENQVAQTLTTLSELKTPNTAFRLTTHYSLPTTHYPLPKLRLRLQKRRSLKTNRPNYFQLYQKGIFQTLHFVSLPSRLLSGLTTHYQSSASACKNNAPSKPEGSNIRLIRLV